MSGARTNTGLGRRLSQLVSIMLSVFRTLIAYLTFTATLLTALTLVVRRDFSNAVLSVVADWLSQLDQIVEVARRIVEAWHEIAVAPLAALLGAWLEWSPSLLLVEIGTLVLFAIGPALRAVWTEQSIRSSIKQRLSWVADLRQAQALQARAISELKSFRSELQASYDDRNWSRAKKAGKALGSIALAGLSLLSGGGSVRFVEPAFRSALDSLSSWDEVQDKIRSLGKDVERLEAEQARIHQRIEALSARDNHLVGRLANASAEEAEAAIRAHVAHRMRFAVALSRSALGVVLAVVLAYIVDWTWPGL
ncbi:hypothetical protein [uncultured Maricaulis sp.]|uniref:hypothetical protein n=1 Tax=uncultured Maricaulis sp. TaxID=174710 RepID=UPI0025CCB6F4|nr:hypothetical protein [uncultured Maricaulis sp.]